MGGGELATFFLGGVASGGLVAVGAAWRLAKTLGAIEHTAKDLRAELVVVRSLAERQARSETTLGMVADWTRRNTSDIRALFEGKPRTRQHSAPELPSLEELGLHPASAPHGEE